MNFNSLLSEEMMEKDFYKMSRNKSSILIFGYGIIVDSHGSFEAIEKFSKVILKKFPKTYSKINLHGRFGMDKRNGCWFFEQRMGGSGHPSNWIEESRGYYCMTNKSIFIFPKDDKGFKKLQKDFELNVLGDKRMFVKN